MHLYLHKNAQDRFGIAIDQSSEISLRSFSISQNEEMNKKIREQGEWKLFPFVIHDLIANGKVAIDHKNNIYINGEKMSKKGLQL